MTFSLALVLALQTNEQLLEKYQSARRHFDQSAFADAVRVCDELAAAKADKEGVLRVRQGGTNNDLEFQPRRLAGDACMAMAKNAAEIETRLKHVDAALGWYRKAAELQLKGADALVAAAALEKKKVEEDLVRLKGADAMRRKLDEVRAVVNRLVVERSFEAAWAELEKAKPDFAGVNLPGWEAAKADVDTQFKRWHDALLADLGQDLETWKPAAARADAARFGERFARYAVDPKRVSPARLDPSLDWAARLPGQLLGTPLEAAEEHARRALAFGIAHWRLAAGIFLEVWASAVRDPGPSAPLEERWTKVLEAEARFAGAAQRARAAAAEARKPDLDRWIAEDLASFQKRVEDVKKGLPDRDAPAALAKSLSRLENPAIVAGGRREGYGAVESEIAELLKRATLEPSLKTRALAALAVARAHALFLDGLPREQVLDRCREPLKEAGAAALTSWKDAVSPRVAWVLDQAAK
ncbi:MAG TPA: hypothetical protein VF950_26180 [Planctomycetota bacterium]